MYNIYENLLLYNFGIITKKNSTKVIHITVILLFEKNVCLLFSMFISEMIMFNLIFRIYH